MILGVIDVPLHVINIKGIKNNEKKGWKNKNKVEKIMKKKVRNKKIFFFCFCFNYIVMNIKNGVTMLLMNIDGNY